MTAFERLLNTDYHLDVFQWDNGRERGVGVRFQDAEIKDGSFLVGDYGTGPILEDACNDYICKISGKTVVFHAYADDRKEVLVI